jgi:hypothetical protein
MSQHGCFGPLLRCPDRVVPGSRAADDVDGSGYRSVAQCVVGAADAGSADEGSAPGVGALGAGSQKLRRSILSTEWR